VPGFIKKIFSIFACFPFFATGGTTYYGGNLHKFLGYLVRTRDVLGFLIEL